MYGKYTGGVHQMMACHHWLAGLLVRGTRASSPPHNRFLGKNKKLFVSTNVSKQEMSLKKTNGVGLKKEENVYEMFINLTQITETLKI